MDHPLKVKQAHRTLQPTSDPGRPPRPILIRFLRFRDREQMILQAAKKLTTPICEDESKLSSCQDLSAEVCRKCREFAGVIEYFLGKGMLRGFASPNQLRVLHQGAVKLFDSPADTKTLINKLERRKADADSAELIIKSPWPSGQPEPGAPRTSGKPSASKKN